MIVAPTVCSCSLVQSCATLGSTERSHHRATQLVITLVVTLSSRSTSPHFDQHSCSLDSRVGSLKMTFTTSVLRMEHQSLPCVICLPHACSITHTTRLSDTSTGHATHRKISSTTLASHNRYRINRSQPRHGMTNSFALDNLPPSRTQL